MRACENAWGVPLISETGNFPMREDNFGDFRTKNDKKKRWILREPLFQAIFACKLLYSKDCCQLLCASPQEKPMTFRGWRPWPKEKHTTKWPLVSRHKIWNDIWAAKVVHPRGFCVEWDGYCYLMQFVPIRSLFMVRSWLGDETSSKYDVFWTCELGLGDGTWWIYHCSYSDLCGMVY